MKTSRALILPNLVSLCVLVGCNQSALQQPRGDGPNPPIENVSEGSCSFTVDTFCRDKGCPLWPRTRADWCSPDSWHVGFPGKTECNGWSFVQELNGDQAIDYFYDSNGNLAAVFQWHSQAPCSGACVYACSAGPPGLSPGQVIGCTSQIDWNRICEVTDGGTSDL